MGSTKMTRVQGRNEIPIMRLMRFNRVTTTLGLCVLVFLLTVSTSQASSFSSAAGSSTTRNKSVLPPSSATTVPSTEQFKHKTQGAWKQRFGNMLKSFTGGRDRTTSRVQGGDSKAPPRALSNRHNTGIPNPPLQEDYVYSHNSRPSIISAASMEREIKTQPKQQGEEAAAQNLSPSNTSTPISSVLGLTIQNLLQHHSRPLLVKTLKFGLTWFILTKLLGSLADFFEQILTEDLFSETGELNLYCSKRDLQKLIHPNESSNAAPKPRTIDVATKLVKTGLPLTCQEEDGNSVEKVLSTLTRAEANLLQQVLYVPNRSASTTSTEIHKDIVDSWNGIAGHLQVKEGLLDVVSLLRLPNTSDKEETTKNFSSLLQPPKGVLLYGPPGNGKSMLIHALAKSAANTRTLLVSPSSLLHKYVGESNKAVKTLFGLAEKLSPTIIVLDELDGLFRDRNYDERTLRDVKTEFLQLWDGSLQSSNSKILVIGATNRPFDVDAAVLRRMPLSYLVGLPNDAARHGLLQNLLQNVPVEEHHSKSCPGHVANIITDLVRETNHYSCSDLRQLLQTAVTMGPLRDSKTAAFSALAHGASNQKPLRPLGRGDFVRALAQIKPTPLSLTYRQALQEFASQTSSFSRQTSHDNNNNAGPFVDPTTTSNDPVFFDMGTLHAPVLDGNHNNEAPTTLEQEGFDQWNQDSYDDSEFDDLDDEQDSLDDLDDDIDEL